MANSVRIETAYGVNGLCFPRAQRAVATEVFFSFPMPCSSNRIHFFFVRNVAPAQKQITLKMKNLLPPCKPPSILFSGTDCRESMDADRETKHSHPNLAFCDGFLFCNVTPTTAESGKLILVYMVFKSFPIVAQLIVIRFDHCR